MHLEGAVHVPARGVEPAKAGERFRGPALGLPLPVLRPVAPRPSARERGRSMSSAPDRWLASLLRDIEAAPAASRIEYRERVLAYGVAFIEPLTALALKLRPRGICCCVARGAGEARAVDCLRRSARPYAASRLPARTPAMPRTRCGGSARIQTAFRVPRRGAPRRRRAPTTSRSGPRSTRRPVRPDPSLQRSQRHDWGLYGRWLGMISEEERASGNPPISAIVVTKATGRPGPRLLSALP